MQKFKKGTPVYRWAFCFPANHPNQVNKPSGVYADRRLLVCTFLYLCFYNIGVKSEYQRIWCL